MNDLRTAAQQALEAMEYHVEQTRPIWKTSEAITALRAALAEPVEERNFCPRCGKRTQGIHTCTPPGDCDVHG